MTLSPQFTQQIMDLMPQDGQQLIDTIAQSEPSISIRLNDAKCTASPTGAPQVPWCPLGFYLDKRPQFTFDTRFQAGLYYVQDASSMFLWHVIKALVKQPVRYLDLCAAPGGKTTAALSALPQGSLVVANEIVPNRARTLRDNVIKWGSHNCLVTSNDPAALGRLTHTFDVIAADVPCSGEGMMRKDDEAVAQWSPQLIKQCAARQRDIIADVWPALKPGGLLIYSTCTYNREENEEMIDWIAREFGARSVSVAIDEAWHIAPAIASTHTAYRFLPHRTRGEGLFMAVLQKPDDQPLSPFKNKKPKSLSTKLPPSATQARQWLRQPEQFMLTDIEGNIVATHTSAVPLLELLRAAGLNVMLSGITLGSIKGKNLIPDRALALSTYLNYEAINTADVDYATAIRYLQGQSVNIEAPRGFVLLTHESVPVGWVNNLGNRANNLLPKALRIINPHTPSCPPQVL